MSIEKKLPRVILYTGKGGTGKSVISCMNALRTAELGYKTLLLSSDPAHSLGDAFGEKIGDSPTIVGDNLWAQHIDPVKETVSNYGVVQDFLADVFSSQGIDETLAYELASLPVMTSIFALLKIEEIHKSKEYEVLVLDTVPSGESLKFIFFPKVFGNISKKLLNLAGSLSWAAGKLSPLIGMPAPSKEVIETESQFILRLERLGELLSDKAITSLRLVSNPDSFSINNMRRTFITSNLYGINVDLAVINKVLPETLVDPFFDKWKLSQNDILDFAETSFYPLPLKKLMLFESELKGMELLKRGSKLLFGGEDPSEIYHVGTQIEIVQEGDQLLLKVKAPFVDKDACEVERIGDEAIVKICSDVGESVNVIPLPVVAQQMGLKKAKILDNELVIYFSGENE